MAEHRETPPLEELPEAVAVPQRRWAFQWVWLLPVIAVVIGAWLAVSAMLSDGPTITIRFRSAEGIEAGKTRIKDKDVDVGVVKKVTLAQDRAGVVVDADMSKAAEELLVEDTRFWVVRARIAGGTVSGLSTLLSGSYVGMDPGKATASKREFAGLETPPVITTGLPGKQFVLRAKDIGSLDVGSPVYYRRLEAGRVIAYELDKEGRAVFVRVFVNEPYDRYVTPDVRFWHASGIDVALDGNGIKLNTESLTSVLIGGLAFQAPDDAGPGTPAPENSVFTLFSDRTQAMKQPISVTERYALDFRESVRGLSPGASVDFRGILVGSVKSVEPRFDRERRQVAVIVEIDFYPERLFTNRAREGTLSTTEPSLVRLVERGLARPVALGEPAHGQLFVALDFIPGTAKVAMDVSKSPPQIPTVPGSTQELQSQVASIAKKLDSIPFQEIGDEFEAHIATLGGDARAGRPRNHA